VVTVDLTPSSSGATLLLTRSASTTKQAPDSTRRPGTTCSPTSTTYSAPVGDETSIVTRHQPRFTLVPSCPSRRDERVGGPVPETPGRAQNDRLS
jgi:hypothetical protein